MSNTSGPEDLQLVDYADVLRRRWWLIIAAAVVGTLAATGYYVTAHKVYSATAAVYVTATAGTSNQVANGRTTGAVNLDTEAQIVQSVTVAQAAAKLMHVSTAAQQLISRVSITVPANSQVLSISCQGSSPGGAAVCAQSFARAYLGYISERTTSLVKDQILVLQKKINSLQSTSAKLSTEIASLPRNSTQRAAASQQLTSDNTQLSSLNSQAAQLTEQLANPSGGSIISYASPPTSPTSPKARLVIPAGFVIGLLAGLILAFALDRRDRRIHRPQDVVKAGVPVLMSLPLTKFRPDLTIATSRSPVGRDFSELAHVLAGSLGAGNHVILVTSPSGGRGTGLVAANLAVALSRSQSAVALVCANVDGSDIPGLFGLPAAPGLTDLLVGGAPITNVARRLATAPQLRVIAPGSAARMEAADLQQDAVDQLLADLREAASWVVVEAPPVASGADVYTLAHAADAVVLVAEVPRTRTVDLAEAVHHLEMTGATVLGAVLLPSPKATGAGAAAMPSAGSDARLQRQEDFPVPVGGAVPRNGEGRGNARKVPGAPPSGNQADPDATINLGWRASDEASGPLPKN